MSNAEQASEPSMEEILSSIRKILDDEPAGADSASTDQQGDKVAGREAADVGAGQSGTATSTLEDRPAAHSQSSTDAASDSGAASSGGPATEQSGEALSPFDALLAASQSSPSSSSEKEAAASAQTASRADERPSVSSDPLTDLVGQLPSEPIDAPKPVLGDKLVPLGRIGGRSADDQPAAPGEQMRAHTERSDEGRGGAAGEGPVPTHDERTPTAASDSGSLTDRLVPASARNAGATVATGATVIAAMAQEQEPQQAQDPHQDAATRNQHADSGSDTEMPLSDLLKSLAGPGAAGPAPSADTTERTRRELEAPRDRTQPQAADRDAHASDAHASQGAEDGSKPSTVIPEQADGTHLAGLRSARSSNGDARLVAGNAEGAPAGTGDDEAGNRPQAADDPLESLLAGLPDVAGEPAPTADSSMDSPDGPSPELASAGHAGTDDGGDEAPAKTPTGERILEPASMSDPAAGVTEATAASSVSKAGQARPSAPAEPLQADGQSDDQEDGSDASVASGSVVATAKEAQAEIVTANVKTMEDTVSELLRPMLRTWLDDNMPRILEKTLKMELASAIEPDDPNKGQQSS